ncbi:transcriptional regulator [Psychromonas sp. MB-3u-54]|uniref:MucB/RseB C-terminal domain-containing protein n=1 Tax=Psychromonas sp. MB-3u-54 TaxID=2058319 RepID=UPI000C337F04|nr:MucB/RseB C-terminal domain-containing protein [Psychromonas sp. MB-3u-54]PKH01753.1 transcriptional regulator [Psychromonas sp. MB-3u-54]
MKLIVYFKTLITGVLILIAGAAFSVQATEMSNDQAVKEDNLTAIEYLQFMQTAYKNLNYEILYLNNLKNTVEPKQLLHGVINQEEIAYFRYLNGAMRESLQYLQKISYFEQGSQPYTLQSTRNQSVFANIANFNYEKGLESYEYIILGKGRIAGKTAMAIRMISKDQYRYSYIIWVDLDTHLPLRLDTINNSNIILDQIMVVSLKVSEQVNPWLESLSNQKLPELFHLSQTSNLQASLWQVDWLPAGFNIVKDDQHKLVMYKNEPVSYIMLNDGIVSVSIYISAKKTTSEQQKTIQRGATVLYTDQKNNFEINVIGEIPVATAKRLIESISIVE